MLENSKTLNIVLISGKARAGKDTFATFLKDELMSKTLALSAKGESKSSHYFPTLAFADGVKTEARRFGWDGRKGIKGRTMLQTIGNSYRSEYFEDIWVDNLYYSFFKYFLSLCRTSTVDFMTNTEDKKTFWLIITDCRYPNELYILYNPLFSRMKDKYGWDINLNLVKIEGAYEGKETLTSDQNNHSSETALDKINFRDKGFRAINNGSLEDLKNTVKFYVSSKGANLLSEKYNV